VPIPGFRPPRKRPTSFPQTGSRCRAADAVYRLCMRALWLTPGYPSSVDPVGFVFHQTQARALAEAGVDLSVVAPPPWGPPGLARRPPRWAAYRRMPRREPDGRIAVERPRYVTTPRETRLGLAHLTQALACRRVERPDVIHAHFAYPCGSTALRLKRRF